MLPLSGAYSVLAVPQDCAGGTVRHDESVADKCRYSPFGAATHEFIELFMHANVGRPGACFDVLIMPTLVEPAVPLGMG